MTTHFRNNTTLRNRNWLTGPSLAFAFMLGCMYTMVDAQGQSEPVIGSELPMINASFQSADGSSVTLGEIRGEHGLVVVFWANSCPWVGRYEDRLIDLAREYQRRGFGFVAVNPNDPNFHRDDRIDAMRSRASEQRYPFPFVIDERSRFAGQVGASRTPQVFIYNGEGRLVYTGAIDDSPADAARIENRYLKDALDAVYGRRNIRTETTSAFGCTIKWHE